MLSVIIPTYNRKNKLKKTLDNFWRQTLDKKDFEIIVVDDGSQDGTEDFMTSYIAATDLNLKYFRAEHKGPGAARNFGITQALGEIIFFCGDDTWPDKDLLKIHHEQHRQQKGSAILGLALWDETEEISVFMRYLSPAGPQFHYNTIRNAQSAGFNHFYTCNISLAKKWLEKEKFDERFKNYSFEDIELGLRLEKRGLKIIFNPAAKNYHWHNYDEKSFGLRMQRLGQGIVIFLDKYKNNQKILKKLTREYAPFCFFPGLKIFQQLSRWLAKSRLVKMINLRYHWFWQICSDYASGMQAELNRKEEIN